MSIIQSKLDKKGGERQPEICPHLEKSVPLASGAPATSESCRRWRCRERGPRDAAAVRLRAFGEECEDSVPHDNCSSCIFRPDRGKLALGAKDHRERRATLRKSIENTCDGVGTNEDAGHMSVDN